MTDVPHAKADYQKFLGEMGMTEEQVQAMVQNPLDQISLVYDDLEVRASLIHGMGMFPKRAYKAGEPLGFARISTMRTQLGRYVNHNPDFNAIFVEMSRGKHADLLLVSTREIRIGEEIVVDYRQAERVR